jgi:hypothetical protein
MEEQEKTKKVRTSITMDPEIFKKVQAVVSNPNSAYKSVSAFIESAVSQQVRSL